MFGFVLLLVLEFGGVLDGDSHRELERDKELERSRFILLLFDVGDVDTDFLPLRSLSLSLSLSRDLRPRSLLLERERERDGERDGESLLLRKESKSSSFIRFISSERDML